MPVLNHNSFIYRAVLKDTNLDLMISDLIILAKSFIYKAKCIKPHPSSVIIKSHFDMKSQKCKFKHARDVYAE